MNSAPTTETQETTSTHTKVLWNEAYLRAFAKELLSTKTECQFWDLNSNNEIEDFKAHNIRKMLMKFFPALGVYNLLMGRDDDALTKSTLVFVRGNRCEALELETLQTITYRIFNYMGVVGDEIRAALHSHQNKVFGKDAVRTIPDLEGKNAFADNQLGAYRFFQNGWVEITRNGVSPLRTYDEIPDDVIVWNSSVINREYRDVETLEILQEKQRLLISDAIHPITGDRIDDKEERIKITKEWKLKVEDFQVEETEEHFRDFVTNLSRDDEFQVDEKQLEKIKLAIGYLCHRHHFQSNRKYVLFVDKFWDGGSGESNGGNGKSLLLDCLGSVMNVANLDGKSFKKGRSDAAAFAQVTAATEIVHFDDAAKGFDTERLFPLTTGDFHIRRLYSNPTSIPARNAPKIAITSNFPLEGNGNSFRRREFILEIGNYYRIQDEEWQQSPYEIHGFKHFVSDEWSSADWSAFYKFVFECISLYLAKGLPRETGESGFYTRAKLLQMIGNEEILDFLTKKLKQYSESGEDVWADAFYKEMRDADFADAIEDLSNATLIKWLGAVGKAYKMPVNKHRNGALDKQRLTDDRWQSWVDAGLEFHTKKNGEVFKHGSDGDRPQFFRVSSIKKPETMVSKPDFGKN